MDCYSIFKSSTSAVVCRLSTFFLYRVLCYCMHKNSVFGMDGVDQLALVASTWAPTCWNDVRKLCMQQVRERCKCLKICYSGRVTKQDLYLLVCDHFNISTSGGTGDCPSSEKPRMPPHVSEAYKKLPSFGHITAGWSVANLCKIPFFLTSLL